MDKEKDVFQTVEEKPATVSLTIEEYKNLIAENAKFRTQVEVMNTKPVKQEVVLEIEQNHVNPQPKEEKGFFNFNE